MLTPEAARRRLRLLIGGAFAAFMIGVISGVLACGSWLPLPVTWTKSSFSLRNSTNG